MRWLLSLFFCTWSFGQVLAQQPVTPANWHPSLDLVREKLEEQLSETRAQQAVNVLTGRLAEVVDAEMLLVYLRLYERLSTAQRVVLRREQDQWLKTREQRLSAYAHLPPDARGSATPAEENSDFIQLTDQRIKELRARLPRLKRP